MHRQFAPRLCIGGAQFGMDYGVTNQQGKTNISEVCKILTCAKENQVFAVDTAQSYGDSERAIGVATRGSDDYFITSKMSNVGSDVSVEDLEKYWDCQLEYSLMYLQRSWLDCLLMHKPDILSSEYGTRLRRWLDLQKDSGKVRSFGVSIYESEELDGIEREYLDTVQLPLSLYDQRLLNDGTLDYLKSMNTSICARSLFLQGLILTPENEWPQWVPHKHRRHHKMLESSLECRGFNLAQAALGFIKSLECIDMAIVGVCSEQQLLELVSSWNSPYEWENGEWLQWMISDQSILDPRRW